ncbi:hypothetical protein B296_00053869 [Ensete ventricosum]|uniref:Uncharacterized protein n=1 Tax=Ensete ventricosum TaxID=4639 RepID=A0A426Y6U2_ENSVE|nr:hypothetical protein B296_00053869 [Ensete ventricosum]
MLQKRPQPSNPNERLGEEIPTAHHALGLGGQLPLPPYGDGNTSAPTPSRYYRLFNDPGFSPLGPSVKHPIVSAEAFLGLTHQVQALGPSYASRPITSLSYTLGLLDTGNGKKLLRNLEVEDNIPIWAGLGVVVEDGDSAVHR